MQRDLILDVMVCVRKEKKGRNRSVLTQLCIVDSSILLIGRDQDICHFRGVWLISDRK